MNKKYITKHFDEVKKAWEEKSPRTVSIIKMDVSDADNLTETETKKKSNIDKALEKESFADVAKAFSEDSNTANKNGLAGYVDSNSTSSDSSSTSTVPADVVTAAIGLKKGETSDWITVTSSSGTSLYKVYVKETKLRVRNIKFALTILFYNLILIGIAVFGFEVLFNSGMNDYVNYGTAIGLYVALVVLESVMVGFLVPSFTAGSIAGEREKQTLEILLTTTMKPSEIVWGKLMASISMVLLLVVSSLPVISIVFTIGGLALVDLLQFVVLVFVAALLMGSIGVWASTAI